MTIHDTDCHDTVDEAVGVSREVSPSLDQVDDKMASDDLITDAFKDNDLVVNLDLQDAGNRNKLMQTNPLDKAIDSDEEIY